MAAITVPTGPRGRLTIGFTRGAGAWAIRWRRWRPDTGPDDDPPNAGVREPVPNRPPSLEGACALEPPG